MDALDLSNNTTRFTVDHVRQWKAGGVGLAIIQLISGVRLAGDDCATQIRTCLDAGVAVDCYIFPRNDGLPMSPAEKLALVPADLRPRIRQLWADVERAFDRWPARGEVDEVLEAGDAWARWQTTGTYGALWVADGLGWHPWPWPDRKQWLVYIRNDGAPNLGGTFDGTDNHVMTQYRMDVTENGVSGMDRSRLTDAEAAAVEAWLNGGEPMPDIDMAWQEKKGLVVQQAGELLSVADQLLAEANRKGGPRVREIRRLANPEVRARAEKILA